MLGDPLTNAAVERRRQGHDYLNGLTTKPTLADITDDFVFEDRRKGAANYGRLDGPSFLRMIESTWDIGTRRPTFTIIEVIAVRGQRTAAFVERTDFGDQNYEEYIAVVQVDASLRSERRYVSFDRDDRDAAIVEADRLHADLGESSPPG